MYNRSKRTLPESSLIRGEWVIRSLDLPSEMLSRKRQMLRWLALSLGLIAPGDERAGILDVLDALFHYIYTKDVEPTPQQILLFVNRRRQERGEKPVVLEAVRYHLRRLEAFGIVEKTRARGASYRFSRGAESSLSDPSAFVDHIFEELLKAKPRIKKAVEHLASLYK